MDSGTGVSREFCEISKYNFFTEHLQATSSKVCFKYFKNLRSVESQCYSQFFSFVNPAMLIE